MEDNALARLGESRLLDLIEILAGDLDFAVNVLEERQRRLHRLLRNRARPRAAEIAVNLAALSMTRALHEIVIHYQDVLEEPPTRGRKLDDLPF